MPHVWLNIDLGETPDEPAELYALAHIANIACGGHAGDDASIDRALAECARGGAWVGAHPSYPDREGFGRRAIEVSSERLHATIAEQCDRLADRADRVGARVGFVKAHGALYHAANRLGSVAEAFASAVVESLGYDIVLIGAATGALADAADAAGVAVLAEGFADRAVRPDGSLMARDDAGALITVPARARQRAQQLMASGSVRSICVHGDTPGAVEIARVVRAAIDAFNAGVIE